ncbi:hypothetical protein ACIRU8_39415 [Streptomyces sp. NPDC101175]|uniref:hypothetical protein n=1 Tax=Streptomyces sp. NPDC101175 TaxID=3366123 RepID=UPI0038332ADA
MNTITRAARAYYRANVHAWEALRRSRAAQLPVLIGMYLAVTLSLNASGHMTAAWIVTVALGLPLLVAGWTT